MINVLLTVYILNLVSYHKYLEESQCTIYFIFLTHAQYDKSMIQ